ASHWRVVGVGGDLVYFAEIVHMEHEEVWRPEVASASAHRDPVLRLRAADHDFRGHLATVSGYDARHLVGEIGKRVDQAGPQELPDRAHVTAACDDPLLATDLEGHGAEASLVVAQLDHAFDVVRAVGVEEGLHDLSCGSAGHRRYRLI